MGGSHKVTSDDEGEGVTIPPKNDDVIYEQPLIRYFYNTKFLQEFKQ